MIDYVLFWLSKTAAELIIAVIVIGVIFIVAYTVAIFQYAAAKIKRGVK